MIQSQLSPASTESSPAPVRQQQVQLYPHACATCVQRKVKCDKRHPCLACSKSHLQCSYRSTPPPQRRKRKIVEITRAAANQALVDKLRDHEAVLRRAGVSFEPFEETTATVHAVDSSDATNTNTNLHVHASGDGKADDGYDGSVDGEARTPNDIQVAATRNPPSDNEPQTSLFPRQHGILISEYGGNRYYEHALIGLLGQQYKQGPPPGWRQPPRAHEDTELPAFLAGMPDAATETQNTRTEFQHPAHTEMLQYWSIFKQNVHPVTMILHAPTTMDEVINNSADDVCCVASSNPPACITTAKDALKFAICACAVASLKDDDCHRLFGAESKSALLKSVQSATRYALTACSFLRLPNLDLLRAFVLLLTSMLHTTDSPSLWVMLGTAVRLAQAQGLHRDGAALALSPFDTEMRRRLWWYIVSLDARITEVMGAESSLPLSTNTQLPCNVNDSALTPGMTVPPKSGAGASDMMLCLIEYETVRLLQRRDPRVERADHGGKGIGSGSTPSNSHITTVSDLERYLEDNFIRFCDPRTVFPEL
ncbi:hypothetical protein Sste5346_004819 [Sporothrix stenoceras]|uniref:Zn(2)-C6 fungal-type domain-containing protein n=1 Tax=Sporothrix stenoceras TaxID=5173 RepID=A0ABR3Z634_9PEZI